MVKPSGLMFDPVRIELARIIHRTGHSGLASVA